MVQFPNSRLDILDAESFSRKLLLSVTPLGQLRLIKIECDVNIMTTEHLKFWDYIRKSYQDSTWLEICWDLGPACW